MNYRKDDTRNARVVINACKPWSRRASFPKVVGSCKELDHRIHAKWGPHPTTQSLGLAGLFSPLALDVSGLDQLDLFLAVSRNQLWANSAGEVETAVLPIAAICSLTLGSAVMVTSALLSLPMIAADVFLGENGIVASFK